MNSLSKLRQVKIGQSILYEVWERTNSYNYQTLIKRNLVNAETYIYNTDIFFINKEVALKISRKEFKQYIIDELKLDKKTVRYFVRKINKSVKILNKYYK